MSEYRDAFRKISKFDLALHAVIVAAWWNDGIWRWVMIVIFFGIDIMSLWMDLRLVYWTKQLHKAQAEGAVLDAAIVIEREYSRYLDEQL